MWRVQERLGNRDERVSNRHVSSRGRMNAVPKFICVAIRARDSPARIRYVGKSRPIQTENVEDRDAFAGQS